MAKTKAQTKIKKPTATRSAAAIRVVDVSGKSAGNASVPHALFAAEVNPQLIAQAVRVYRANQREGSAHTKTRGEVSGSTRKIYRQKGTGRARHGGIRAPIFVGGGIVFGPQSRLIRLKLSKKMGKRALAAALTEKKEAGQVLAVAGVAALPSKTSAIARMIKALGIRTPAMLVVAKDALGVRRAARNLEGIHTARIHDLTTYDILSHKTILFMKEALGEL